MIHRPQKYERKDPAPHLPFPEDIPASDGWSIFSITFLAVSFLLGLLWEWL